MGRTNLEVCAVTTCMYHNLTVLARTTQSRSTQSRARAWWSRWYCTFSIWLISQPHCSFQVSQLEVEIQVIPQSVKPPYTTRLKQAKSDLTKYKKLSKDLHSQAARTDLLGAFNKTGGSLNSDDPYGERSDRTRLLAGTQVLSDGSRRITESTSIALETESHGADILRTLVGQREQIENSRNTVSFFCRSFITHDGWPFHWSAANCGCVYQQSVEYN